MKADMKASTMVSIILVVVVGIACSYGGYWYAGSEIKNLETEVKEKKEDIGKKDDLIAKLEGELKSIKENAPAPCSEGKSTTLVPASSSSGTEKEIKNLKKELKIFKKKTEDALETLTKERKKNVSSEVAPTSKGLEKLSPAEGSVSVDPSGVLVVIPKTICELTSNKTARLKVNPTVTLPEGYVIAVEANEPRLAAEDCGQWRKRMAEKYVVGH